MLIWNSLEGVLVGDEVQAEADQAYEEGDVGRQAQNSPDRPASRCGHIGGGLRSGSLDEQVGGGVEDQGGDQGYEVLHVGLQFLRDMCTTDAGRQTR